MSCPTFLLPPAILSCISLRSASVLRMSSDYPVCPIQCQNCRTTTSSPPGCRRSSVMNRFIVLLLAQLALAAVVTASGCTAKGIDLSSIGTVVSGGIKQQDPGDPEGPGQGSVYYWAINLCEKQASVAPKNADPCDTPAYVSQYIEGDDGVKCATSFEIPEGGNPNVTDGTVTMVYSSSTASVTTNVVISCDRGAGKFDFPDQSQAVQDVNTGNWQVTLNVKSSVVCSGGGPGGGSGKHGLTGGGVFLLIFFLTSFVYFAGFVTFNYFKREQRGRDVLPHPEFWGAVPGYVKEGCVVSYQKVRSVFSKGDGGGSYETV